MTTKKIIALLFAVSVISVIAMSLLKKDAVIGYSELNENMMMVGQKVSTSTITFYFSDGSTNEERNFSFDDYISDSEKFMRELSSTTRTYSEGITIHTTTNGFDTRKGVIQINNEYNY